MLKRSGSVVSLSGAAVGLFMALFPVAFAVAAADTHVTVYPQLNAPGYIYSANDYAVKANGISVPVRDYRPFDGTLQAADRNYYYAHFGISGGSVTVEVDAKETITSWSISPKAYNIVGSTNGSRLTFSLDQPRYLAVRINGKNMLFVLADPDETSRPASSGIDEVTGRKVFNVAAPPYDADRTGTQLATAQLQKAIDDAAADVRRGIVYVPAGLYTTFRLTMKDHVWLYLEPGAVLMPDPARKNWWMGWEPDHMLTIGNTIGNRIYGRGVIYCRNEEMSRQHGPQDKHRLRLRPMKIANVTDFTLEGITGAESGEWTFSVEGGERIALRNVKVLNEKKHGTNDGIDICGGSDIVVEHCFVSTMDDAYCLKGMRGTIRNVRFCDNVADTTKSAFKVGMQGMSEISDVSVSHHHVIRCYKGLDLCHYYGSADWRDIVFSDCRIEKVMGKAGDPVVGACTPIRLIIDRQTQLGYPKGVGSIYDIAFERIRFDDPGPNPMAMKGYDVTNSVRSVKIRDVYFGDRLIESRDPGLMILEHTSDIGVQRQSVQGP